MVVIELFIFSVLLREIYSVYCLYVLARIYGLPEA